MIKKSSIRSQEKRLFSNTFFLYLLTFSTQLFSFITVPYLSRILGPSVYGKVGIAQAYMAYVQIILDFGLILSATQKVVEFQDSKKKLGELLSIVVILKLLLSLLVSSVFVVYILVNDELKKDITFYLLFLVATIFNALMPDFYYRGIEQMKTITIRTFFVKGLSTALTFVFVHTKQDYWMIPFFQLLGNVVAVLIMYIDIYKKHGIRFERMCVSNILRITKDTVPFFISRVASTFYQGLNTIILSFVYGASNVVGYYTSADKVVSLSKSASSPIADSLYPYMLKEKNFRLVKKMMMFFMPIIVFGVVGAFIFADTLCVWLFGIEYQEAGNILRCLLPIVLVIFPTYVLCFPVMVPLGLSKWANFSNVIGLIVQVVGLGILLIFDQINVYTICCLSSFSEVMVFLFRLFVVVRFLNKKRIKVTV